MESVLRALAVYAFLLVTIRLSGKRTLSNSSPFELVLLLIISETTQEAMVGGDHSVTNAFLLITTLIGTTIALSLVKQRWPVVERLVDGQPLMLVDRGRVLTDRMSKVRVDEGDLLEAARQIHGLKRMDEIEYAVLERSGEISIIPRAQAR
jgi:uncharacterized membrane protein YcaP (DUF421 family)